MVRCEICHKEKPIPGVSFHKFPKDTKQLHLWIAQIHKENYVPKAGSVVCSMHFPPECLEQKFNRVRLKKGSVPTLLKEESHVSNIDRPPLDENVMQRRHEATYVCKTENDCNELDDHMESTDSFMQHEHEAAYVCKTEIQCDDFDSPVESRDTFMQPEHEAVYICKTEIQCDDFDHRMKNMDIFMQDEQEVSRRNIEYDDFTNRIESTNTSAQDEEEIASTSKPDFRNILGVEHNYAETSEKCEEKLLSVTTALRAARHTNRVLQQKVKRLQKTVASLKSVISAINRGACNSQTIEQLLSEIA